MAKKRYASIIYSIFSFYQINWLSSYYFLAYIFQNYVLSRNDMFSAMFLIGTVLCKSYFVESFWNLNYYSKFSMSLSTQIIFNHWWKLYWKTQQNQIGHIIFFFKNRKKYSAFLSQMSIPSTSPLSRMFSINVSRVEWYEPVEKFILPDIRKVHKNGKCSE